MKCHCEKEPITVCADCDREYLIIDVRYYRQVRDFEMVKKLKKLERRKPKFKNLGDLLNSGRAVVRFENVHGVDTSLGVEIHTYGKRFVISEK